MRINNELLSSAAQPEISVEVTIQMPKRFLDALHEFSEMLDAEPETVAELALTLYASIIQRCKENGFAPSIVFDGPNGELERLSVFEPETLN